MVAVGAHQVARVLAADAPGQVRDVDPALRAVVERVDQVSIDQRARSGADRRERPASRIGGQAALGLEAAGEIPVSAGEDLVLLVIHCQPRVPAVGVEITHAAEHADAVDVAAAFMRRIDTGSDRQPLIVRLGDEVDHAADRVGTVHGRCAITQHLDTLDGGEGNGVQVDHLSRQPMRGYATTVQQHEGGVGTLAT